jgi:hypothetical protein
MADNADLFDDTHWLDDGNGNKVERPSWIKHSQLSVLCSPTQGIHFYTRLNNDWLDDPWQDEDVELYECCTFRGGIEQVIWDELGGEPSDDSPYGRHPSSANVSGHVVRHLRDLRDYINQTIAYLETLPESPKESIEDEV